MPASRYLNRWQQRGLAKLGDVFAPGDEAFPSFSALGCGEHVDEVLEPMAAGDLAGLKLLLGLLGFLPRAVIAGFCRLLERAPQMRGPWGGPLRFLRMGLKGLVLTLYYSGKRGEHFEGASPLEVLDYRVGVFTADLPPAGGRR